MLVRRASLLKPPPRRDTVALRIRGLHLTGHPESDGMPSGGVVLGTGGGFICDGLHDHVGVVSTGRLGHLAAGTRALETVIEKVRRQTVRRALPPGLPPGYPPPM